VQRIVLISLVWLAAATGVAQTTWADAHSDAAYSMMAAATIKLNEGKIAEAAMIADEAFEEMAFAADPDQLTAAALLKFRIADASDKTSLCLEHLIYALVISENANSDYRQSALLTAIVYYDINGMAHLNSDLIDEALLLNAGKPEVEQKLLESKLRTAHVLHDNNAAIIALEELYALSLSKNDRDQVRRTLVALGTLNYQEKNYDRALVLFEELRTLASNDGSTIDLSVALNNLALCLQAKKDYETPRKLFADAQMYCPKTSAHYCEILINSAFLEKKLGNLNEARQLVERANGAATKIDDPRLVAKTRLLLATIWDLLGETYNALDIAKSAASYSQEHDLDEIAEECYRFALKKYSGLNDRENAQYCTDQLNLIARDHSNRNEADLMKRGNLDFELGQLDKLARADWNQIKTKKLEKEKSLANKTSQERTLELMRTEQELMKSEFERTRIERQKAEHELALAQASLLSHEQEASIMELEKSKTAQMLEVVNLKLETQSKATKLEMAEKQNQLLTSEAKLNEEKVKNERTGKMLGFLTGGFALLALIGAVFVIRKMRATNKTIAQQHANLDMANREVLESIASARHFQASIIPSEDKIKNLVSDSFIYYEPMDEVSGDLPFMYRKDDKLFIAAIDCIGHGVPAAMLTFITHFNLKQIIEDKIHLPGGEVLRLLHERLVATMKEHAESQGFLSGIDISFCVVDLPTRSIQFAGAQLPLLVQTKSGVEKLKGDPYSVGDLYLEKVPEFKTCSMQLQPGDRIFLLSDGFIHQLGGASGRHKFSLKALIATIEKGSGQSMSQIKNMLREAFSNWKGNQPQTDDVMVLGITLK
jgi:serine phosphatase RsbU (regulator of sigma subunit)